MKQELERPAHHSMAHHLVTYAANNMIAPLVHAQIARDEHEAALESNRALSAENARLREALENLIETLVRPGHEYSDKPEAYQLGGNTYIAANIARAALAGGEK
jgi:hypothetical protein